MALIHVKTKANLFEVIKSHGCSNTKESSF